MSLFLFVDYMQLKLLEIKEKLDHLKCQSALTPCAKKWAVVHGYSGQAQHLKTGAIKYCSLFLKSWTKSSTFHQNCLFWAQPLIFWTQTCPLLRGVGLSWLLQQINGYYWDTGGKNTHPTMKNRAQHCSRLLLRGWNILYRTSSISMCLPGPFKWLATRDFKSPWNDQQNASCFGIFLCFP